MIEVPLYVSRCDRRGQILVLAFSTFEVNVKKLFSVVAFSLGSGASRNQLEVHLGMVYFNRYIPSAG